MPHPNAMLFLKTGGLFVHPALYEFLYLNALNLAQSKDTSAKLAIRSIDDQPLGDGLLSTSFKYSTMGAAGGIEFNAEISIDSRQFKITFIIDERYLYRYVPGTWQYSDGLPTEPFPSAPAHTLN